jgi:hypothetical protein
MTKETCRHAGILLVIFPTVLYGGVTLLTLLISDPRYMQNPLRQNLWRAGHAHAGVLLILSLVSLIYVEHAQLSRAWKQLVSTLIPSSAILLPAGFFLSVLKPTDTVPNNFIYLCYAGAVALAAGLLILGIGLLRKKENTNSSLNT